jgi:TM2 domain-containing membrane protein YozV
LSTLPVGQLSPDGTHYWDGRQWVRAVSVDGQWRWSGAQWVPNIAQPVSGYMVAAGQPGAMVVTAKNPAISLLVSFFVPGVGSLMNGDTTTGVLILCLFIVSIPLLFFLIGVPLYIGVWIWGMIDAYQGAQRWNARHGILS